MSWNPELKIKDSVLMGKEWKFYMSQNPPLETGNENFSTKKIKFYFFTLYQKLVS
jgi:hypothetical protein